jgi:hypothetical protein
MLLAEKDAATVPPKILLKGVVDESVDLKALLGGFGKSLNLYCKDVSRINSLGVKLWKEYFATFRKEGGEVKFFELSPALVASMNTVLDFVIKSEALSVCAPFLCENCDKSSVKIVSTADVPAFVNSGLTMTCPFCKAEAEFDDLPMQYFSSILRWAALGAQKS